MQLVSHFIRVVFVKKNRGNQDLVDTFPGTFTVVSNRYKVDKFNIRYCGCGGMYLRDNRRGFILAVSFSRRNAKDRICAFVQRRVKI